MSKSEQNLKEAFAGESQANRKYLAFAKKAEQEGLPGVARLFQAAAAAETVHAHNHLRVLGGIKTTADLLKVCFSSLSPISSSTSAPSSNWLSGSMPKNPRTVP